MSEPTFNSPLPGQSLTSEPRSLPYERPPEMDTVTDALKFYTTKFDDEDVLDDLYAALEEGFPLDILVGTILTGGVMEGKHSLDVKLLIRPVLHELLLIKANAQGIDVVESAKSLKRRKEEKDKKKLITKLERAMERMPNTDAGTDILKDAKENLTTGDSLEEATPEMPLQPVEETPSDAPLMDEPMGLMSRRN